MFAHPTRSKKNPLCLFDIKSSRVSGGHGNRARHEYYGSWYLYPREDNSLRFKDDDDDDETI